MIVTRRVTNKERVVGRDVMSAELYISMTNTEDQ